MRLPVLIAGIFAVADIAYRAIQLSSVPGTPADAIWPYVIKSGFSWGTVIIIFSLLGLVPQLGNMVDIFSLLFITVIVLNDGYDILQKVSVL